MVGSIVKKGLMVVAILIVLFLILRIGFGFLAPPPASPPPLAIVSEQQRDEYLSFLQRDGLSPEDYIIEKFKRYDVIMLGEFHRIQHDPLFVQRLIPVLYRNGIHLLGFEFACPEDQLRIDSLLGQKRYDETLAIDILRNLGGFWPYQEYLDVFKAAWTVNVNLSAGEERFRVLALSPWIDWEKANYGSEAERAEQMRLPGLGDSIMAEIIERNALAPGKKILVYCGRHHAFSKYCQPVTDDSYKFRGRYVEGRVGQRILKRYPNKTITVMLHAPCWYPTYRTYGLFFGGILDQAFAARQQPVGFDVAGSPFADLTDSTSQYALGYGKIQLSQYCDGYIILNQMKDYRDVNIIKDWLKGVSFSDFKRRFPKKMPGILFHPKLFMWFMAADLDWAKRFGAMALQLEHQGKSP